MSHGRLVLLLLLVGYLMLMAGNSLVSLTHPDEVFYTQTAKEMLARHSWLVPYIFDQPQFEKPILTYWLLIVAAKVFGFTSFAMRFWPAVFGMFGVMLTYWLAVLLFQNKRMAFVSAVVLSTSVIHFALSRSVLTDMIFSMWVVLTLVLFYDGIVAPERRDRDIVLLFAVSGIAVLTKGILGFVFPAAVISFYLFYKKDSTYFCRKSTWMGVLLFLAIAVPWHMLMYQWYGQGFIDEYFKNVHVRRIYEAEHLKSDTWYFYLVTMIGGMFPWSFFLFPTGFLAYKRWMARHADKDKIVFLALWVGLVVFIMQLAKSKLASYIFPVFVPLSVFVGYYFEDILRREQGRVRPSSMSVVSYTMAFLMLVVSLAGIFFAKKYNAFVPDMALVYIFMVLAFVSAASIFIFNRQGRHVATIGAISSVTVLILVLAFLGRGYAEPWVSCRDICEVFNNRGVSNSTLLCSKFYVRGVRYYTGQPVAVIDINGKGFFSSHPIPFLNDDGKALTFLNNQPVTYCFLKESNVRDIERITQGKFIVTLIKEIGGKYLIMVKKI